MRYGLVIACGLMASGCATTTDTAVISACAAWRPIEWSRADTDETIRQVRISNARRAAYCRDTE